MPSAPRWHLLLVVLLTTLALLPFAGKALHIDDPLFVWAAKHIAAHPADPYGFDVNWYGESARMSDVTKNPPAVSYYLALAGGAFGWSEIALHLAMLVPAMLVAFGTWLLAVRFTTRPLIACGLALATPGFLVSATTVMSDVPMLAAWLFATWFWLRGIDRASHRDMAIGMALVAVATLTKYYGLALFPLLMMYAWLRRPPSEWWFHLVLPTTIVFAYHLATSQLYGRSLLLDAFGYATDPDPTSDRVSFASLPVGLSFVGGCVASIIFMAPRLWSRARLLAAVAITIALAVILASTASLRAFVMPVESAARWSVAAQVALWAVAGGAVMALAFQDWRRRRDADALLLLLWIAGTFVFATFVNWTVNARSVLPIVIPAGILMARRLDVRAAVELPRSPNLVDAIAVGFSAILALAVAAADSSFANANRDLASRVHQQFAGRAIWFQGHWGFQYYMEQAGARPVDVRSPKMSAGELIASPEPNTNVLGLPPELVRELGDIDGSASRGFATVAPRRGAMFYGDMPLPFAIARDEKPHVRVFEMGRLR